MFSVREVPWHGEGFIPDHHPETIEQAIEWAGLDWTVEQRPLYFDLDPEDPDSILIPVPEETGVANVRSSDDKVLGVVTKRYQPLQNVEAFNWLSNLYGTDMLFETAGSLQGGRRVWVLMKLPDWITVAGDPYVQYAFISNSHDGKSSVQSACTPIRIVCRNTELAALRGAKRVYSLRHMGDMSSKIAEARNVLGVTVDYYKQFAKVGDQLGLKLCGPKAQKTVLEEMFPIDETMGGRAAANLEESREAVKRLLKGETSGNAEGSYWGMYNALTEYADWGRDARVSRLQKVIDDADGFKSKAFQVVTALAGVAT